MMERSRFAGCFLDSSDPRLRRHVVLCETAGGGTSPLPAGKDEKLSREFEGRALIGREATVPPLVWDTYPQIAGLDQRLSSGFGGKAPDDGRIAARLSSLDCIKNNRHNGIEVPPYLVRPNGRTNFCGRWSITGTDPKTGRSMYRRVNCGSWHCSYCGPRKAREARAAIRSVAQSLGLRYFLTLTLDPSKLIQEYGCDPDVARAGAVPHLRRCFNKFREYLRRKYGAAPSYVCILEFTKAGVPHLHVLFDRYIEQQWISHVWDSLGGGRIVWIKQVQARKVANYLAKYLTKDLLLSAPKGVRRITTARSIKLFPKLDSGIVWELLRESIWRRLERFFFRSSVVLDNENSIRVDPETQTNLFRFKRLKLSMDEDNFLKAFEVFEVEN